MKTRMDSAGRVVIPKALRQALSLKTGQSLEIRAADGRLEIDVTPTSVSLRKHGTGLVAVPERAVPPLTAEDVRDALEAVRR